MYRWTCIGPTVSIVPKFIWTFSYPLSRLCRTELCTALQQEPAFRSYDAWKVKFETCWTICVLWRTGAAALICDGFMPGCTGSWSCCAHSLSVRITRVFGVFRLGPRSLYSIRESTDAATGSCQSPLTFRRCQVTWGLQKNRSSKQTILVSLSARQTPHTKFSKQKQAKRKMAELPRQFFQNEQQCNNIHFLFSHPACSPFPSLCCFLTALCSAKIQDGRWDACPHW